jgi:hypothetical protein
MTCIMPSASAASVPGMGRTCRSATWAVRVRSGSMTTTVAPFCLASRMNGHRCRLVTMVFVPHRTMKRLCAMSSGWMPMPVPLVTETPVSPVLPQMALMSLVAPRREKKRRSMELPWTKPCVPAKLYGSTASPPNRSTTPRTRAAMSPRASSRETRSNSPDPFGPARGGARLPGEAVSGAGWVRGG